MASTPNPEFPTEARPKEPAPDPQPGDERPLLHDERPGGTE